MDVSEASEIENKAVIQAMIVEASLIKALFYASTWDFVVASQPAWTIELYVFHMVQL